MTEELKAGKSLDATVSRMVFGRHDQILPYSESIEAAWTVVEALRKRGINLRISMCDGLTEEFDRYTVEVGPWSLHVPGVPDGPSVTVEAETAPLAICRAALKAVGGEG